MFLYTANYTISYLAILWNVTCTWFVHSFLVLLYFIVTTDREVWLKTIATVTNFFLSRYIYITAEFYVPLFAYLPTNKFSFIMAQTHLTEFTSPIFSRVIFRTFGQICTVWDIWYRRYATENRRHKFLQICTFLGIFI